MENQNSEVLTCYFEEAAKKGQKQLLLGSNTWGCERKQETFLSSVELLNFLKLSADIAWFKTKNPIEIYIWEHIYLKFETIKINQIKRKHSWNPIQ